MGAAMAFVARRWGGAGDREKALSLYLSCRLPAAGRARMPIARRPRYRRGDGAGGVHPPAPALGPSARCAGVPTVHCAESGALAAAPATGRPPTSADAETKCRLG